MNIKEFENYLNIDTSRYKNPTLEALNYYTEQYMLTVPFENIDVQNGVRISVEVDDIYNKIVNRNRGGYCYEMNILFQAYLITKGFNARISSATIHTPNGGRSQPGSHVSLFVIIDDIFYVADVGFGDLPLHTIPITTEEQTHNIDDVTGVFRGIFQDEKQNSFFIQKWENSTWNTKYEAELKESNIHDFDANIEYNQTNPNSTFVKRLIITMPKYYGRVTMSQDNLTITEGQKKYKKGVTKENYRLLLQKYFNMNVKIQRLE